MVAFSALMEVRRLGNRRLFTIIRLPNTTKFDECEHPVIRGPEELETRLPDASSTRPNPA